jgi:hypothetical protein
MALSLHSRPRMPIAVTIGRVGGMFREFFFLQQARKKSAELSVSQRRSVETFFQGAKRRLAVARRLREPDQNHVSLSLYHGAALLLTFAYLVSKDESVDLDALTPDAAFQKLAEVRGREQKDLPPSFGLARRWVIGRDPLAVERLSAEEAGCAIDDFEATTRWLLTLVEPRSVRSLQATRIMRALATTLGVTALAAWGVIHLFAPKNIARRKPTQASSADYDTKPAAVVDGERNGSFGFHSRLEDSPWWSVDLRRSYSIKTIKVFGRGDCCFQQSVPLALEVSDGVGPFRRIAERTEPFSEKDPWVVVPSGSEKARVVRLRSERSTNLVLSEVEVYGR